MAKKETLLKIKVSANTTELEEAKQKIKVSCELIEQAVQKMKELLEVQEKIKELHELTERLVQKMKELGELQEKNK